MRAYMPACLDIEPDVKVWEFMGCGHCDTQRGGGGCEWGLGVGGMVELKLNRK